MQIVQSSGPPRILHRMRCFLTSLHISQNACIFSAGVIPFIMCSVTSFSMELIGLFRIKIFVLSPLLFFRYCVTAAGVMPINAAISLFFMPLSLSFFARSDRTVGSTWATMVSQKSFTRNLYKDQYIKLTALTNW